MHFLLVKISYIWKYVTWKSVFFHTWKSLQLIWQSIPYFMKLRIMINEEIIITSKPHENILKQNNMNGHLRLRACYNRLKCCYHCCCRDNYVCCRFIYNIGQYDFETEKTTMRSIYWYVKYFQSILTVFLWFYFAAKICYCDDYTCNLYS